MFANWFRPIEPTSHVPITSVVMAIMLRPPRGPAALLFTATIALLQLKISTTQIGD